MSWIVPLLQLHFMIISDMKWLQCFSDTYYQNIVTDHHHDTRGRHVQILHVDNYHLLTYKCAVRGEDIRAHIASPALLLNEY